LKCSLERGIKKCSLERGIKQGYWGAGAKTGSGSESDIFRSSRFGSDSRSIFYIIYIYILYFDAYMSTKACRMMN